MKTIVYVVVFLGVHLCQTSYAQISRELQDAINHVPFARFDYPANRDRNNPPEVASPQAFVFAYYKLPYAINLKSVYSEAFGDYIEKILINFDSVDLPAGEEKQIIQDALIQLQELIDRQIYVARMTGFADYFNFSRSYISRFYSNGRALIAIRELMSSQDLFNILVQRAKLL